MSKWTCTTLVLKYKLKLHYYGAYNFNIRFKLDLFFIPIIPN